MKIEHNQPETQSKDLTTENIEQLKKLFPNIVEEGKVNFDVLRQLLGEEVVSEQEYYRFTWPGKHQARQEALKSSTGTLRPAKDESVDWDKTENLYIEGDNLEVLKLLQKSYFNKVKMIYIDPPYNTGKDFVYKDNYKDNLAEYNEKFNRTDAEGNVLSSETNNEGNARYHSNWLNMMYPRLQLARTLLKDDGVIFISIDDNEVHNLKRICDEIFGEENFVGNIIWRKKYGLQNDAKYFSVSHENLIVFAKNKIEFKPNLVERSEKQDSRYRNIDNDHRGPWKSADLSVGRITDKDRYEIETPSGRIVSPPEGRSWVINEEKFKEMVDDNRIWFGTTGNNVPSVKKFLTEVKQGLTPSTFWDYNEVGHTDGSNKALKKLFDNQSFFDYPKPVKYLKKMVVIGSDSNDIIIDFFAGSSTTAHAVMDLNKEDLLEGKEANRKYIMVQLPEPTDEKSEAHKAGYKNISEIGKERIRRAASQIKEELKDQPEVLEKLDLGFKVFKLDSSNIHTWDTTPEELENNLFRDEVIKEDRTAEDVLYEVLLKYGLDLTYPIEEVTLDNKKVYSVGAGQLIFCLEDGVTRNTAQAIIDWAKEDEIIDPKIVFKDAGFTNDVEKTNIIQLFKTHGVMDVKSI